MEGVTPLEYLLTVMRTSDDEARQLDAAKAAAPYVHARLANIDATVKGQMGITVEIIRFGDGK